MAAAVPQEEINGVGIRPLRRRVHGGNGAVPAAPGGQQHRPPAQVNRTAAGEFVVQHRVGADVHQPVGRARMVQIAVPAPAVVIALGHRVNVRIEQVFFPEFRKIHGNFHRRSPLPFFLL